MSSSQDWSRCNLCGKTNARSLFKKDGANIVKCKTCGLVYRSPQLAPQEVLEIYREIALVKESKIKFIERRMALYKYLLNELNRHAKKGRLLDIGCQFGYFLKLAKKEGWQTFGVDVSRKATAFAKEKLNLNVFAGTLKEANFPDEFFDAITLWDVLYQMSDPTQELKKIRRILKKEGSISLRLENVNFHLATYYLYQCFRGIFNILGIQDITKFHIYEFSPATIKKMLKKTGFRDIKVKNSLLTRGDLYDSFAHLSPVVIDTFKKILFFSSLLLYYLSRRKIVFSSAMIVHARK